MPYFSIFWEQVFLPPHCLSSLTNCFTDNCSNTIHIKNTCALSCKVMYEQIVDLHEPVNYSKIILLFFKKKLYLKIFFLVLLLYGFTGMLPLYPLLKIFATLSALAVATLTPLRKIRHFVRFGRFAKLTG